ncbi:MAG: hypothetical protein HDT30_12385 [Clostridiales bacterium]|nr:hypothetical protein [Clostridiales bacterium]
MEENNFSLLSQEEIDSLVSYLKGNTKTVESKVLNQESIDKLIMMMQTFRGITTEKKNVRAIKTVLSGDKTWELQILVNENTNYIELYATEGSRQEKITPESFLNGCFLDDDSQWGFSISPTIFCNVASLYGIRFTKETYEQVVRQFAKVNYGTSDYSVPAFYLADSKVLSMNLLEKM